MKSTLISAVFLSSVAFFGCAQANSDIDLSTSEVEAIIKNYLLKNPEVLRDAFIELDKKQDRLALAEISDALYEDPRDSFIGQKNAKVTIVEFFDYNCGFCKKSAGWVEKAIETYPKDVKIIFKELPILDSRTKTSKIAAKAAIAANKQGKFTEIHFALMNERSISEDRIYKIAEKVGLNITQLKNDMNNPDVDLYLADTLSLATRIPSLSGTPFFIIGDNLIPGADEERLDSVLQDVLSKS